MLISKKIKEIRYHLGLSQTELAKKLRVSVGTYHHWESGNRNPSPINIRKIVKIANENNIKVSYEDFFR